MKKLFLTVLLTIALIPSSITPVFAGESATPEEVLDKVMKCAFFLMEAGEEGIKALQQKENNEYIWKDTYVHAYEFVDDPAKFQIAVHQFKPALRDWDSKKLWDLQDKKGNYIIRRLCKAATAGEDGGWAEYWWPKAGEEEPSRKITYIVRVPGTNWAVLAGIYDDNMSIDELNRLTAKIMQ